LPNLRSAGGPDLNRGYHQAQGAPGPSLLGTGGKQESTLIQALENAGREGEILAVCEQEARVTGSYERLVRRLIEMKQYDDAERWAAERIEKTIAKKPGIASSLEKLLAEMATQRSQWPSVAAHAALEFFSHPGCECFQQLIKAASKAGCEERIREFAVNFLKTGVSPLPSPGMALAKDVANGKWPLSMPDYLLPLFGSESRFRSTPGPHFDVLIDIMAYSSPRLAFGS
jgi:uncharacterized Zn finger protein